MDILSNQARGALRSTLVAGPTDRLLLELTLCRLHEVSAHDGTGTAATDCERPGGAPPDTRSAAA